MQVQYDGRVGFNTMHSTFGFQKLPPFAITDYLQGQPILRDQNTGLFYDPALDCAYTQVVSVPYDQVVKNNDITVVDATNNTLWLGAVQTMWTVTTTASAHAYKLAPWGSEYVVFQDPNTGSKQKLVAVNKLSDNTYWDGYGEQGYDLYIGRYLFTPLGQEDFTVWQATFTLMDGQTAFAVQALSQGTINILASSDGGNTFVTLRASVETGLSLSEISGNTLPQDARQLIQIRAIAMNDAISFRINDGTPFVTPVRIFSVNQGNIPPDYLTAKYPRLSTVAISCDNFSTFTFVGQPLKWIDAIDYISARYSLGFSPQNDPKFDIATVGATATVNNGGSVDLSQFSSNPPGTLVTAQISPNSFFEAAPQFELLIQNPTIGIYGEQTFSNHTVVLSSLTIRYDGIYLPPDAPDGFFWQYCNQDLPYTPKEIAYNEEFNVDALCVQRTCSARFSNWWGLTDFSGATGVNGSGNFAMAVDFAYLGGALQRRFTGYCDTIKFSRPEPGNATIELFGTDRMQQLAEVYIFDPPNFDNFYHYYAMRFLAEFAGIPENQLFFYTFLPNGDIQQINVPDNPFVVDPHDPDPWGLPIGTANRPWTPIQRQLSVLELAEFIRKAAGCFLGFLSDGRLAYGPWIPPNPQNNYVKTFYEAPQPVFNPELDLNEIWNLSVTNSTRNTRTKVTLVSVDPYRPGFFEPPSVAVDPQNSQVLAPPGSQPYNYIGYEKVAAMSDPRFGLRDFRVRAARNFYNLLSQPTVSVTFECWMQPDLSVLDIIYVQDIRSYLGNLPLTIVGHKILLSATDPGQIPRSIITARYLPLPSDPAIN